MAVWPTIFCSKGICGMVRGEELRLKRMEWEQMEYGDTLTLVRSTPVRALTDTGSSASRRFTSPVTRLPSPLKMTISLVLAKGAATLPAIWTNIDRLLRKHYWGPAMGCINCDEPATTHICGADLGQSLQHQSCFGSVAILLVGLSFQPHLLSLCLSYCFNRCSLCLANKADLFSLCLSRQHSLCPGHTSVSQYYISFLYLTVSLT